MVLQQIMFLLCAGSIPAALIIYLKFVGRFSLVPISPYPTSGKLIKGSSQDPVGFVRKDDKIYSEQEKQSGLVGIASAGGSIP